MTMRKQYTRSPDVRTDVMYNYARTIYYNPKMCVQVEGHTNTSTKIFQTKNL